MRSGWLCTLFLAFASCTKEYAPGPNTANNNPTSYLLKKVSYDNLAATNGESFHFTYNLNNLITEIRRVQWGGGLTNGTPQWYDTSIYHFTYDGELPIKCTITDRGIIGYFEYFYHGDQMYKKLIKYADGTIQRYTTYSYDSMGRLTEAVDSSDKVDFRHILEYGSNLTTSTTYSLWRSPQTKTKTVYSFFDGKVNFMRAINGLPMTYKWDSFNLHYDCSVSPNNMGRVEHFWDVDTNKEYEPPTTSDFSYDYNEEGLPTRIQSGGSTVTLEYQKYK